MEAIELGNKEIEPVQVESRSELDEIIKVFEKQEFEKAVY